MPMGGGGKWSILGSKMIHPHNSGSTSSISFTFAQLKGPRGMIVPDPSEWLRSPTSINAR